MSNLPEDQTDNWDCEYLAVMILQQQEADEDNREVYRVQKCRMKKELIDMEKDMKGKGQVKRRRIIQSIIQIAKQFEEPLKLRDKSKSKDIQIRELKKLVDTTEQYWTEKVKLELRDEYSKDKAEAEVQNDLQTSRKVNQRLLDEHKKLEEHIDSIRNNYILTPKDEHQALCDNMVKLTLSSKKNTSNKTEKQLRKKIKKLEKQVSILKSLNSDTSSSDEDNDNDDDDDDDDGSST